MPDGLLKPWTKQMRLARREMTGRRTRRNVVIGANINWAHVAKTPLPGAAQISLLRTISAPMGGGR